MNDLSPASEEKPQRLGWADLRKAMVEVPALPLAALYFFCLLCGYYVLRPVRDAMGASPEVQAIFPRGLVEWTTARGWDLGDFTLQLLFTCTFISMLVLQPLYGALVSRYPRRVFLPVVYAVFIACLFGFYLLFDQQVTGRGIAFFVWVAVFNLFAVSVFWSYMSDIFSNQAARLFYGFIGVGGTLGAMTGPLITKYFSKQLGVANLLLVSIGFLLLCLIFIVLLAQHAKRAEQERGTKNNDEVIGGSIWAGFKIVRDDPMLRAFAMLMFFGVGVGTLLYNEQAAIAKQIVSDEARTAFYANIDFWINVLTLTVQLVITPFVLFRYGVLPLLLIPAIAITLGYGALAAMPIPMLVAVVQIMTRAGEFSMSKPARETIYTRVNRETRYKAKAFIDTAVYRGGDLSFVWLHKFIASFGSMVVFVVGIFVALGMTFGAWKVIKEQEKLPPSPK
jgi:ATP:ADP antiporter, AAA family